MINEVNNGTISHSSHHDHGLEDARSFVQHMVGGPHARYWDGRRQAPGEEDVAYQKEHGHKAWLMNFMDDFEQRGLIQQNDGVAAARLAKLQDTEIEGMLMTDDLLNSQVLFALISRQHWKSVVRNSAQSEAHSKRLGTRCCKSSS